jgi:hypothetical protein
LGTTRRPKCWRRNKMFINKMIVLDNNHPPCTSSSHHPPLFFRWAYIG